MHSPGQRKEVIAVTEIGKVNWVVCPKCQYRFYCGPPIFHVKGVQSICPKCHHEFDPHDALEPRFTERTAADKKL